MIVVDASVAEDTGVLMVKKTKKDVCKLFQEQRPLVKAHIIPQAFTRRIFPKFPFMEMDGEQRPKRQWSSWYDPNLVCAEAENLFAKWDNYAAELFSRNGLTFRSGKQREFDSHRFVEIENVDVRRLRLFGLSILWRASATSLEAFEDISLPRDYLDQLQLMLLRQECGAHTDYPILFLVYSDCPESAVVAPQVLKNVQGIDFVRFFLDGVIVYVGMRPADLRALSFGKWLLGADRSLHLLALPYEGSWQQRTVQATAIEEFSERGDPWGMHARS